MTFRRLSALITLLTGLAPGLTTAQTPSFVPLDTAWGRFNLESWNPWSTRTPIRLIPEPVRHAAPDLDLAVWSVGTKTPPRFTLKRTRGKVVVLDFWNRNCPPCIPLHKALMRLAPEWQASGVEVVSVLSSDSAEGLDVFLADHGGRPPFPMVLDPDGRALEAMGGYGFPTIVVLDHYGRVALDRLPGSSRIAELGTVLPTLLAARARR